MIPDAASIDRFTRARFVESFVNDEKVALYGSGKMTKTRELEIRLRVASQTPS